ncbi:hypothetical protein [Streptomyces sp. G45]|uniref:hypothetical protein n=1 Tax=Streptomyces sp. G45 TaxID=3406627 RepID=UPI003C14672A
MDASSPGLLRALYSAFLAFDPSRHTSAWDELERVVTAAARHDEALARLWSADPMPRNRTALAWWHLAQELDRIGSYDADLHHALTDWLRRQAPPPPAPTAESGNVMADSVLHGPTVQAREIHGDVHFHATAPRPTPSARPAPRQLPAVTALFTDREDDQRVLDSVGLRGSARGSRILVVTGLAGVGKTSLVSRWLQDHSGDFPDGQLYADLGGHSSDEEGGPVSPTPSSKPSSSRWASRRSPPTAPSAGRCGAPRPRVCGSRSCWTTPSRPPRYVRCCWAPPPGSPW